ncbi:putative baseplate assembly protein [Kitasatospora sp. NPDC056181]|uniref:putative baseplate assembly protein n=1 Tax=Kitasatospora sp. NPDC056181 TaxID=3345737 RepID=UPI0035E1B176
MSTCTCGCCAGGAAAPPSVANPPGQAALRLRTGTHATFLAAMLGRLSAADLPGLAGLTTRDPGDPAIALCDAGAAVCDVLTFYQERIGNEGYLRTATEARSVHELTALVGYRARPGVAAGTHLAFTLEAGHREVIPAGTRAQSLPGPGELPQAYETGAPLPALADANRLPVRTTRPQPVTAADVHRLPELWLAGTATRLGPNDLLLIGIGPPGRVKHFVRSVDGVEEDLEHRRTRVLLAGGRPTEPPEWEQVDGLGGLIDLLTAPPSEPAPDVPVPDASAADARLRREELLHPGLSGLLHGAWAGATVSGRPTVQVYALRVAAPLFGHNAGRKPAFGEDGRPLPMEQWSEWRVAEDEAAVYLDNPYPSIRSGTVAVIALAADLAADDAPTGGRGRARAASERFRIIGDRRGRPLAVSPVSRAEYGLSTRTTRIDLGGKPVWEVPGSMDELRRITVHAAPEPLPLAELPITDPVQGAVLELDGVLDGLESGRLLVVSGERADLPGVAGVAAAELVKVAEVRQGTVTRPAPTREPATAGPATAEPAAPAVSAPAVSATPSTATVVPGEHNHSFLILEAPLLHSYKRDTVTVYGNVVHATHGETRVDVLGSGDASAAHQTFPLRGAPLTYVSAPTPTGVESTLDVTVDAVRWPERPWFAGLGPDDRGYVTSTDETGTTSVTFPDGTSGHRPATGSENIRARYRTGTGTAGNTDAGRITLLAAKPLSVREVVNPLPATGGADPERPDQARTGAPLPLKTLDRLVSLPDYADFARAFAGVGKATADRLSDGRGGVVVVTVAGADGTLLSRESDVVRNLRTALRRFGDPAVRIRVLPAERLVLSVDAEVRLLPDRQWAAVEPLLRAALLDAFGPVRRDLAQGVPGSEVVALLQSVPGVHSVRGLALTSVPEGAEPPPGQHPGPWLPALGARRVGNDIVEAQHLCTAAELPELIKLREGVA